MYAPGKRVAAHALVSRSSSARGFRAAALWALGSSGGGCGQRPVKAPLARRFAKSHSIIDKLCEYMLFSQSFETRAAEIGSSHTDAHTAAGFFTNLQRARGAGIRAYPLFLRPPCRWDSRNSAARPVPIADNFLLKQQKQRERRFAKGRCGSLSGRPRGLGNGRAILLGGDAAT
jgi:hypothetical protein